MLGNIRLGFRVSHLFLRFLGIPLLAIAALLAASCMKSADKVAGPEDSGNVLAVGLQVPAQFTEVQVVSGLASPTAMEFAPDGRLFVCEQAGKLRVIKAGSLLATPFLTVTTTNSGERGLLGIAFDPEFTVDKYVYVYYTATSPNVHNRLSRFTVSSTNPDLAASGSETILLELDALSSATNHNGGSIHFGKDGKLYIAVGENANGSNAQTLNNLLGKMLRLNKDGSIPTDNPFYNTAAGKNRAIWALGLRNPFTFSVQPGTGRVFINDVGQSSWEEIDDGLAGANYGWPTTEGYTSDTRFKTPFYAYGHSEGCAITGGAFYNPSTAQFPAEYVGDYFFAEYCSGWIRKIDLSTKAVTGFATGLSSPVDLKVGPEGSLYYVMRGGGVVRRISYTGSQAPVISTHPANRTVSVGQSASFTVTATGTAPLAYRWERNGVDIAGATASTYTLASAQTSDNNARFRAVVSNSFGSATSNEAVLTVTTNQGPTATINTPAAGTVFSGGQVISYSGSGTDPEDGALGGGAFTWQVDLHHDTHVHPFVAPTTGATSGSFTMPTRGETSANIWYRIYLTVKDAGGLTHQVFRDILPRKVDVTLAAVPTGLQLKLDGQPVTAPHTFTGVVGIIRAIEAVSPQALGGKTWSFVSWSDGGARSHEIATPASNATYTATFNEVPAGVSYEAENAVRSGAVVSSIHAGYTGTGFADYINPSGDYVEWTVNSPAAGSYRLDFRYALLSGGRPLEIRVNGAVVSASLAFPATGAWTTWSVSGLNANLAAGANKVRATAIGSSGANMDNLVVK